MATFTHHIFICCNQRPPGSPRGCCDPDGGEKLRERFKAEVKKRGLGPQVRANSAGCLDQCECGPTVVIYPQGIWYGGVQPDDVPRILDETILAGRLLDDLVIPDEILNTRRPHMRTPLAIATDTPPNDRIPEGKSPRTPP